MKVRLLQTSSSDASDVFAREMSSLAAVLRQLREEFGPSVAAEAVRRSKIVAGRLALQHAEARAGLATRRIS